jgi:hypothetical protein
MADRAAPSAESARARALDPKLAAAQDRDASTAAAKKAAEDKRLTNMLRTARAAGYAAVETAPGEFKATRNPRDRAGRIRLGTVSKQLEDVVLADAKARFVAQERAKADALEQQAKQAQVNAEKLLQQIAANTKAGPVI